MGTSASERGKVISKLRFRGELEGGTGEAIEAVETIDLDLSRDAH